MNIINIDNAIVAIYLIATLIIGFCSGLKLKNFREYAVSHQNYSTPALLATIFGTIIGANSTIGVIAQIYIVGIIFILAPLGQALKSFIAAKYIAPNLKKNFPHAISIGDIFHKAYGNQGRLLCGVGASIASLIWTSGQIFAIAKLFNFFFGLSFDQSVLIGYCVIIIYSTFGGINAVVKTDIFQFFIMVCALPILASQGLKIVGGYDNLFASIPAEKMSFTDFDKFTKHFSMMLIFAFFHMSPVFLQRILIAPDVASIKRSLNYTSIITILFFAIVALMGLIAISINPEAEPNHILYHMVQNMLPTGMKGIVICGIIAAIMSTADSALNLSSVSIYNDIIKVFYRKEISDKSQIFLIRFIAAFSGLLTIIVARSFQEIVDMIIFGIYFWAPIVLIPLYGIALNVKISQRGFITCAIVGACSSLVWILYLSKITNFEGLVPTMILTILTFLYFYKKEGTKIR